MRALPAALPGGAQRAKVTGMARSVDAKTTVEAALPPPSSRMPKVRRAGGGLSLGRAVGASDHGSVECGGETGSGVALAGGRPARQYGLNWKSVASIVKRAVQYGLKNRARPPVHVIGIDEVSRRKGQV